MCFLLIYRAIFSPWCPGSCPLWGGATTVKKVGTWAFVHLQFSGPRTAKTGGGAS